MYCGKCGAQLRDDVLFCPQCGSKVAGNNRCIGDNPQKGKSRANLAIVIICIAVVALFAIPFIMNFSAGESPMIRVEEGSEVAFQQVLIDTDDYYVEVQSYFWDQNNGFTLKLYQENHTDKAIAVNGNGMKSTLNKLQWRCNYYSKLGANSTSTDYWYWQNEMFALDLYSFPFQSADDVTVAELALSIIDLPEEYLNQKGVYAGKKLYEQFCVLYPHGEDNVKPYTHDKPEEKTFYQDEELTVKVTKIKKMKNSVDLVVYFENNSPEDKIIVESEYGDKENPIGINGKRLTLNGNFVYDEWESLLPAGTRCYKEYSAYTVMEELGIAADEVENMQLSLKMKEASTDIVIFDEVFSIDI